MAITIINLDKQFKPFGDGHSITNITFPSNIEQHINVNGIDINNDILITCRIRNMNDFFIVLLCNNALKNIGCKNINLFIPYLPYSRQDRICSGGDAFSLKVVANILNTQEFKKIFTFDVHSNVSTSLINNLINLDPYYMLTCIIKYLPPDLILVAPDFGAIERVKHLAKKLNLHSIHCSKTRDPKNGALLNFSCNEDVKNKHLLIVDDICSRGGTFIGLSDLLKQNGASSIHLYVSHYEGSATESLFKDSGIDIIFKSNSINDYHSDFVINLPLFLKADIL